MQRANGSQVNLARRRASGPKQPTSWRPTKVRPPMQQTAMTVRQRMFLRLGTLVMRTPNNRPQRTCVGCMERDSKDQMLRIAAEASLLTVDEEGRRPGRGGYLHPREECITKFTRSK